MYTSSLLKDIQGQTAPGTLGQHRPAGQKWDRGWGYLCQILWVVSSVFTDIAAATPRMTEARF